MSPAALLVLVALGYWYLSTRRTRRRPARNPYNPRRRKGDRCFACGRPLRTGDVRWLMPTGSGPRVVLCQSCADELVERREARGESGPALRRLSNPRRRRPGAAGQLALPETPAAYPVVHVAGGGKLPNRKRQPFWVFAQWAGVSANDSRWFTHDPVGRAFSSYAEAADVARDFARRQGGVFEPSREARHELLRNRNPRRLCRCGSGAPCKNPYTQACALPGGHVYDFTAGGRCQCCGRMAPRRTVELESRAGEHARYGRTCAARSIGTTKLRTNQLEHMEREAEHRSAREAHYRGAGRQASGIVRPTFARGWSEAEIVELARRVGESPFEPHWWLSQTANLVPAHYELTPQGRRYVPATGEYRRFVLEGGQRTKRRRGAGSSARSARPARARAYARPGDDLPW
jgi:hypothetical protein